MNAASYEHYRIIWFLHFISLLHSAYKSLHTSNAICFYSLADMPHVTPSGGFHLYLVSTRNMRLLTRCDELTALTNFVPLTRLSSCIFRISQKCPNPRLFVRKQMRNFKTNLINNFRI